MYGCAVAHKYETTSIHYTKLKNTLNFHHIFFVLPPLFAIHISFVAMFHIFVQIIRMKKLFNTKIKV